MLKIKEFAKLCGTSTFTLRYYDEHEVLCPHETDPATGYRYYHPDQQKDMETILTLKGLGFSLDDIKRYLYGSIQIRRELLGQKKKEIEYQMHCAKEQIRTIHALCGQDILSLSEETVREVKNRFEDDPEVLGRWDFCGILPEGCDFTGEDALSENTGIFPPVLLFLPDGMEYWVFFWSRGILYHVNRSTNLLIPNPYRIFEYQGQTYLRLTWLSEEILYQDGREVVCIYRKTDSRRYDHNSAMIFRDDTDLPFVPDPRLVGTWDVCRFVRKPEDFDPRQLPATPARGMFDRIRCTEDGRRFVRCITPIGYQEVEHRYTRGLFINNYSPTTEHYEFREIRGTEYLIAECKTGDYLFAGLIGVYCVFRRAEDETDAHRSKNK